MGQLLQNLVVGGVIAVVVMAFSLIGMIVCAKKQHTVAIAKPMAVILMVVVLICAVVILMKTGVLGDQGTQRIIQNELVYAKTGEGKIPMPGITLDRIEKIRVIALGEKYRLLQVVFLRAEILYANKIGVLLDHPIKKAALRRVANGIRAKADDTHRSV